MKNKEALINRIEKSFSGIPPGEVGLRQANALDMRENEPGAFYNPEGYNRACAEDRETDWKDIPDLVLGQSSVFPFLDDVGFKFVLPAYMRWRLKPDYHSNCDVVGDLVSRFLPGSSLLEGSGEYWIPPNALAKRLQLSQEQMKVLVEWLHFVVDAENIGDLEPDEEEKLAQWDILAGSS